MKMTDRALRILHVEGMGLVVSDIVGRIHLLGDNFEVLKSSPRPALGRPLYGLAVHSGWVIGKDRMGAVLRWSLDTFDLANRIDPVTTADRSMLIDGEEPSPCSSRGIAVWQDRVYVTSGYPNQMLVLDLESFAVLDIIPNLTGESPMEWACTEYADLHAISDKAGVLRFGDFGTRSFDHEIKLDDGNIHRVRYDARHDRFWCTQDFGQGKTADVVNGLIIVSREGVKEHEVLFARDDVEFVIFGPGCRRAYAGGFDGELVIFDNTGPVPVIERIVAGFPHQLIDITIDAKGNIFVLCQDGEILRLEEDGRLESAMGFARQAIWDIRPSIEDRRVLYCATDSGVAVLRQIETAAGTAVQLTEQWQSDRGFIRRVVPVEGGWLCISRQGWVQSVKLGGQVHWSVQLPSLLHTVALSSDGSRLLVASNEGGIELDAASGERLTQLSVDGLPIWAANYLPSGERLLVSRNGVIAVFDATDVTKLRWRLDQGEYPKRAWYQNGFAYVTGDGGLKEIEIGVGVRRTWRELFSNTVENAVVQDGFVYASSYGMQLAAFRYDDAEMVGFVEDLPDYPKALHLMHDEEGVATLLVGCRGGLLSTYRLDASTAQGVFAKQFDVYLPRVASQVKLWEKVPALVTSSV